MLRTFIVTAASVALFTGYASAQAPDSSKSSIGIPFKSTTTPTQEEIERNKANDRAYDAALHKIPDKKSAVDPWGNIRPAAPAASKNKPENKAN
jgi:hypothetical protein